MSNTRRSSFPAEPTRRVILLVLVLAASAVVGSRPLGVARAAGLTAGVAKVDITNREPGPVNDPLFVKALAKDQAKNSFPRVLITLRVMNPRAAISSAPTGPHHAERDGYEQRRPGSCWFVGPKEAVRDDKHVIDKPRHDTER